MQLGGPWGFWKPVSIWCDHHFPHAVQHISFALSLYNESVMISSLTCNVFIHINFQCQIHIKYKVSHIKNMLWRDSHKPTVFYA